MRLLLSLLCLIPLTAKAQLPSTFDSLTQPAAPDYAQERYWSALPFRTDAADVIPSDEHWVNDSVKEADVFYIYPTIYQKGKTWNADLANKKLNKKIDDLPVRFQAGVFNASCRVYAPRYRQGNIECYYDSMNGPRSLDFAYQDVARAFQYYLDHYNHGRPIIIASHSQGSNHSWRLLIDFFDGKPLAKQLVCAYAVGMGVDTTWYKVLRPCGNATETGCYATWSSFRTGYDPGKDVLRNPMCVNPITWQRDTALVPAGISLGGIFLKIRRHRWEHAASAQVHQDLLWVRTRLPFVRSWKVLHLVDYNLFWYDIRHNVAARIAAYLKK